MCTYCLYMTSLRWSTDQHKLFHIHNMPRCNGLPDVPCPHNKCDSSVNLSQGDLMLCKHCSNVRYPAQAVTVANSVKSLETGNGSDKECMPGMSKDDANNVVIRQLPDLNSVADDKYDDVFIRSLNTINQYSLRDIQDQLQKASIKVLTVLHKALCDKVLTDYSQYKDRRAINSGSNILLFLIYLIWDTAWSTNSHPMN